MPALLCGALAATCGVALPVKSQQAACRMSDLAAPFLAAFPSGEDGMAFWAFEALMRRAARNFRSDEQGIQCADSQGPTHAALVELVS